MSPRVSIEIRAADLVELRKEARVRVAEALAAARGRGLILRRSHVGVVCGLADWHLDEGLKRPGVSLAGAVVLHLQPEPSRDGDALAAAAAALGVSLAWIHGAETAWAGELMDTACLAALDASLYLDGYEVGEALWLTSRGPR